MTETAAPKILIIDDDAAIRHFLRHVLEEEGYEVVEAGDGGEGLRIHAEGGVDLVITDIVMPGIEGFGTIIALEKLDDVKIIAISGGGRMGSDCYLETARDLGVFRAFSKPLDRCALLEAVAEALAESGEKRA